MKKSQYSNTPPLHHSSSPITLVSGGQTGSGPRSAGLGVGARCGMRGMVPEGRKAEDGPIDTKHPLKKTPSAAYLQRTEWNVRDSDATVLFSIEPALTGGSLKTVELARKHNKPRLHLCEGDSAAADKLKAFVQEHHVKVLNVAGRGQVKSPGWGSS